MEQPNVPKAPISMGVAGKHVLHLKGPIEGQELYSDWIDTIRGASPHDTIELHINTGGGNVYTAIELMAAFAETEAHVHVIINGICASAGTMIMTVGDSFEISPWTTFMFHNYSGGTIGKGNEMHSRLEYERKWSTHFMMDVYEGLLTEDEIMMVLDGKDFWLSAEDVGDRLGKMVEYRQEKMAAAMEEVAKILEGDIVDLEDMTKKELLELAKEEGLKTTAKMTKKQLIELLED